MKFIYHGLKPSAASMLKNGELLQDNQERNNSETWQEKHMHLESGFASGDPSISWWVPIFSGITYRI